MNIKKSAHDSKFDVFCRACNRRIGVEKPEDLIKIKEYGITKFRLICPHCGRKIWIDSSTVRTMNPDLKKQVKLYEPNYMDKALKAAKKFNKEFKGTFDNL